MSSSVCKTFVNILHENPELSPAIAAMTALFELLKSDTSTTLQELIEKMRNARNELGETDVSVVSISSGSELLIQFITLAEKDIEQAEDFQSVRQMLIKRSQLFLQLMSQCHQKVTENSVRVIQDGMKILTHSKSRNVLSVMVEAARKEKQFHVYVTEARPSCSGTDMAEELMKHGINCTVILDAAVSYIIEQIDIVMLGAEGVCENGGIINKIGTCNIATLAHLKKKPVYVFAESYKFLRALPMGNADLPKRYLHKAALLKSNADLRKEHPLVDYTPPDNITLLYTDLGVLPTSAVTEHLIILYT